MIKVHEIYDIYLPKFVRGLHVGLGKRLYLETEMSGKPKAGYKWLRNEREVTEQARKV